MWPSDVESDCQILFREQMFEMPFHRASLFAKMRPSVFIWNCMWKQKWRSLHFIYTLDFTGLFFEWNGENQLRPWCLDTQVDIKGLIGAYKTTPHLCLTVFLRKESWKVKSQQNRWQRPPREVVKHHPTHVLKDFQSQSWRQNCCSGSLMVICSK